MTRYFNEKKVEQLLSTHPEYVDGFNALKSMVVAGAGVVLTGSTRRLVEFLCHVTPLYSQADDRHDYHSSEQSVMQPTTHLILDVCGKRVEFRDIALTTGQAPVLAGKNSFFAKSLSFSADRPLEYAVPIRACSHLGNS